MNSHILFLGILAFGLCIAFVPLMIKLGKKWNIMDVPSERKIHTQAIPRSGGIAIILSAIIVLLINHFLHWSRPSIFLKILPSFVVLIVIGIYDDKKGSNAILKFSFQTLAAILLYINGISINLISNPFGGYFVFSGWLSFLITIFWVVGLINAINLLDGMDGLATGVILISSIFIFIIAMISHNTLILFLSLLMIAITSGFLVFNFPPAKIFMGDTGSMFLGFMMALIGILGNRKSAVSITLLFPIILLIIPIFDTFLAIVRRVVTKKNIFQADKKHLHHRFLSLGISQRKAVLIIYGFNIYLGLLALFSLILSPSYFFVLLVILLVSLLLGMESLRVFEKKIKL